MKGLTTTQIDVSTCYKEGFTGSIHCKLNSRFFMKINKDLSEGKIVPT